MAWILGECGWSIITTFSVSGKFPVIFLPRTLPEFRPRCHSIPKSRLASERIWCAITTRPGCAPCSERPAACGVARTVSDIH